MLHTAIDIEHQRFAVLHDSRHTPHTHTHVHCREILLEWPMHLNATHRSVGGWDIHKYISEYCLNIFLIMAQDINKVAGNNSILHVHM